MEKNDRAPLLRRVPAWLAMPLMTLMALGLVAFALTRRDPNRWQDLLFPAILGSVLLLVMVDWLLRIRGVEQRLTEERNLLRVLIHHLPDRVYIKDIQGRRLLSNPADWQAAGAGRLEDVLGKTVFELYPPELAAKYALDDKEVLETGQPFVNREQPSVDSEGMPIWTLATQVPLRDTHNNLIGIIGIVRDITAFKQATEAERIAEERFRNIFEESVEGIYQTTPDGTLLAANPALSRMLGYASPEEMINEMQSVAGRIYVDPGRRAEFQSRIETTGTIAGFESEIYCKGGNTVWISENGRVVRDPQGKVLYYEGTMVDITERKHAEEAQRKAEERYRSFFEDSIAGIFQTTLEGRYLHANPALAQMLGYDSPEELMRSITNLEQQLYVHEGDRAELKERLAGAGQVSGFEAELHRKDGSTISILMNARLARASDNKPLHIEGTVVDISARKQMEQAQQATQHRQQIWINELEQRSREISLLNEMSDLIQCCPTVDEAYRVIEQQAQWLFPQDSGSLYIINSSRNLAEAMATWGPRFEDPPTFKPGECWAFRRGQLHAVETIWADDPSMDEPLLFCSHVQEPVPDSYVCVPLLAQGETLGMLHLRHGKPLPSGPGRLGGVWYSEVKRQLARTVADSLALSISNLTLRDKLRQQSIRDPLTGLFNRRYMEESIDREIARSARSERPLGVIMLDIDHFKRFNDEFGHAAGDAVLRELGSLLASHVRTADIACRYGGEEFALIMPDASLEIAAQRAEEVRDAIARLEVQQGDQRLGPVRASFGVAEFPRHGRNGDAIIQMADGAMYQAKQAGRNQVRVADLFTRNVDASKD